MCLYPKTIENRKYKANKKNGGIIPPINDNRTRWIEIGCEQCMECRKKKAREWQVRLLEDIKTNTNGKMITLTFSNESIKELSEELKKYQGYDLDNAIATLAMRRFLERWRKKYKKSIRHWMITELGHKGTENIHLHGIIWTNEKIEEIKHHWKYGFTWDGYWKNGKRINYVNEQTINYTIKYVNKIDLKHKTYKPIILTSSGIGNKYKAKYNKYKGTETDETYRTRTGHKITLPPYLKNKIYTEEEKEKLWIIKLDKQEKWVDGQKIDISKGLEKYNNLLETAREKNRELGYLENDKYQKRKKYELERRKILHKARGITPSAESIQKGPDYIKTGLRPNIEITKQNLEIPIKETTFKAKNATITKLHKTKTYSTTILV